MKIAVLHKFAGYGGGARFAVTITKILEELGFDVDLYTIYKVSKAEIYRRFGKKIRARIISMNLERSKLSLIQYSSLILNFMPRGKYDIAFNISGDYVHNPMMNVKNTLSYCTNHTTT